MKEFIFKHASEVKGMVYAAFLFLQIDTDVVKILMLLMFLDTIFGILKAVKLREAVSFRVLFFGVSTKALVLLIPMTLALVGKGLKYDFTPLVDVVLRLLVVAEGISIFASFYTIRTGKKVENVDFITMILASIRKGLMKVFGLLLKKIENPDEVLAELKPESEIKKTDE